MRGIFWNNRGLSDLAKSRFLRDTSREQNLDFIALLETCKKDFSQETLNNFSGGRNFVWHWTAPHGRSGEILLGANLDVMDVGSIDDEDFFVKFRRETGRVISSGSLWLFMGLPNLSLRNHSLPSWCSLVGMRNFPYVLGEILISLGAARRRVMIDLRKDGPSFLMQ
jgi:hypothetical protein